MVPRHVGFVVLDVPRQGIQGPLVASVHERPEPVDHRSDRDEEDGDYDENADNYPPGARQLTRLQDRARWETRPETENTLVGRALPASAEA